ncbi:BgTH12-04683 [Blumeria graminis f. sp. triticale]|uniref:Bgt-327 n=3 Tax=Blumeria graminis TaxID=34373 RepID=A0A061HC96_BLUGR|nr:Myo-inositol transporter [Blumeria graminis f. sp. tritici 96224]CAD6499029.1 BgTH12-04683 [Blumeria graminis f. sp. triticale]VCU39162.1 Bgt-327 [Blumeria graminis f. sp. tritici]
MVSTAKLAGEFSAQHHEKTSPVKMKAGDLGTLEEIDTIEETDSDKFVWLVSLTASLGGFLFGYDTGIISAVLIYLHADLGHELANREKELVTSVMSGGAFLGAIAAGLTADRYGRKGPIYMGCVLFIVGAVIQATAYTVSHMAVGRAIVGLGVGSAAMIIPLYIAEISPAKFRGRMMGLDTLSVTGGQLASYGLGAGFAHIAHGWRWMVGMGAGPAILLLCLLPICPESPRQLIYHKKLDEAAEVIQKVFPNATGDQVQQKVRHIALHVETAKKLRDGKSNWWLFKQLFTVPANLRVTIAACGVMSLSQFSGFNNLMYYSSTLFAVIGFSNPVGVGSIIAAVNFLCTFLYFNIVDRFGRRQVLLSTVWGMGVSLGVAAAAFYYIPLTTDLSISADTKVGWPAYLVLVAMVSLVIFYGSGIGALSWVSSEFFPMEVRSLGTMVMTLSNWGPNIIISSTFLTQMEKTTPTGTFAFYGVVCILGWVAIYCCYPEVKGMTLESIREVFEQGFGVQKAREIQAEMRRKSADRSSV